MTGVTETIMVMRPEVLKEMLRSISDICLDASVENTFEAYADAVGEIEDMIFDVQKRINGITSGN